MRTFVWRNRENDSTVTTECPKFYCQEPIRFSPIHGRHWHHSSWLSRRYYYQPRCLRSIWWRATHKHKALSWPEVKQTCDHYSLKYEARLKLDRRRKRTQVEDDPRKERWCRTSLLWPKELRVAVQGETFHEVGRVWRWTNGGFSCLKTRPPTGAISFWRTLRLESNRIFSRKLEVVRRWDEGWDPRDPLQKRGWRNEITEFEIT